VHEVMGVATSFNSSQVMLGPKSKRSNFECNKILQRTRSELLERNLRAAWQRRDPSGLI